MSTLLNLQNLSLSFPHKLIFKDASFTLNQGDKIGVLGLNGHGKSSLFKILMDQISVDTTVPPFIYDKSRELSLFLVPQELIDPQEDTLEEYFYRYYPQFDVLYQELKTIGHKLSNGEGDFDKLLSRQEKIYADLSNAQADRLQAQYISYLKTFGLMDMNVLVKSLSGGEQRKVALSLGLSCPQRVVLWDEPTNHLDVETIKRFEEELEGSKKTFLIISHDRTLLNNVVDRIVHIQFGKIQSFQGTYADYLIHLQNQDQARAKALDRLENDNRRETAWIRRGVQARRTKSKKRISDYDTLQSSIRELKGQAHKSVSLNLQSSQRKSKVLVEAENMGVGYKGVLIDGMNFRLHRGDKIALMGGNGVGKSTLLKTILGQMQPYQGKIRILDQLDTGYFSQKRESLNPDQTPWDLIGEGIDFVISNTGDKRHVASYLESFLFRSEEMKRPIHTFSGGEKNRLQLAQFMKHARDLWIFDEPTNDLDLETIGVLEEELKNYQGALIVVGHDRAFIENVTDKCWLVHDKKLEIFEGGWPQAEMYLEALELEADLKKLSPPSKTNTPAAKGLLSNKERARLDKIGPEMSAAEKAIALLQEKIAAINYADPDSAKNIQQLNTDLEKSQQHFDRLFEEWAELEEKR